MAKTKKRLALTGLLIITLGCSLVQAQQNQVITQEPASNIEIIKKSPSDSADSNARDTNQSEGLSERFASLLKEGGLGPRLVVFLLAMIPISELRGAIILGIVAYKLPWLETALIALAGNLIPVVPILLFLDAIMKLLGKVKFFNRLFDWLRTRARKKGGLIERYEYLGLFLFVAVPLPVTGAWTGALIASVLRLPFWPSFISIVLGVLTADILVTSFSILGWWGLISALVILPVLWLFSNWLEKRGRTKNQQTPQ